MLQRIQRKNRVGVRGTGPHFGGDPDGFHDFLGSCTLLPGRLGMTTNAIGALRHMRHGDGDQLFGLRGQRPFGKYALAECLKRLRRLWRQVSSAFRRGLGSALDIVVPAQT